jgi:hypothetical protein
VLGHTVEIHAFKSDFLEAVVSTLIVSHAGSDRIFAHENNLAQLPYIRKHLKCGDYRRNFPDSNQN